MPCVCLGGKHTSREAAWWAGSQRDGCSVAGKRCWVTSALFVRASPAFRIGAEDPVSSAFIHMSWYVHNIQMWHVSECIGYRILEFKERFGSRAKDGGGGGFSYVKNSQNHKSG